MGMISSPPFVEFDLSIDGFGCLFLPSVFPLSIDRTVTTGGQTTTVSTTTGTGGGGERPFPPSNGLTFSSWILINKCVRMSYSCCKCGSVACDSHVIVMWLLRLIAYLGLCIYVICAYMYMYMIVCMRMYSSVTPSSLSTCTHTHTHTHTRTHTHTLHRYSSEDPHPISLLTLTQTFLTADKHVTHYPVLRIYINLAEQSVVVTTQPPRDRRDTLTEDVVTKVRSCRCSLCLWIVNCQGFFQLFAQGEAKWGKFWFWTFY